MNERCLGMKKLTQRHTGEYLCTVLNDCIEEYGWKLKKVIAMTSDNGSNMGGLLKKINVILADETELHENADAESHRSTDRNDNVQHINVNQMDDYMNQQRCDEEIVEILHHLDEDDQEEIDDLLMDIDFSNGAERETSVDDEWEIADVSSHDDLPNQIEEISGSPLIFVNGVNCAAHQGLASNGG